MGSAQNMREKQFNNFSLSSWEPCAPRTTRTEYGQSRTYRNRYTHEHMDRYDLVFTSQNEEQNYYRCFKDRLTCPYTVNAVYYHSEADQKFCGRVHHGQAYVQHIPVRLCDVTDIPFPENLYMLKVCLLGFRQLYFQVGYFPVKEDLVCVDAEGHVRVWMNANLSNHNPVRKDVYNPTETLMVSQIVAMIQRNTEELSEQELDVSVGFQQNGMKFEEGVELVEKFAAEHQIKVPNCCQSIVSVFAEEYGDSLDRNRQTFAEYGMMLGRDLNPSIQNGIVASALSNQSNVTNSQVLISNRSEKLQTKQSEVNIEQGRMKIDEAQQSILRSSCHNLQTPSNLTRGLPHNNISFGRERPPSPARVTFNYANQSENPHQRLKPLLSPNISKEYPHQKVSSFSEKSSNQGWYTNEKFEQLQIDPQIYEDMLKYL